MTPEQFDRWKDFAFRMARTAYPKKARSKYYPDSAWIEQAVADFIGNIDPLDICVITGWDGSDDYPEGHPRYRATERHVCYQKEPRIDRAHGPCLGDDFREFEWDGRCDIPVSRKMDEQIARLQDSHADDASAREDELWDELVERWYGPVHCCVRAGLDTACPDGAGMGVVGHTAGDVRRMYPEGVPGWVTCGDKPWNVIPVTGSIPGIGLMLGEPQPNGTFAEMPDDAQVWL